LLINLPGMKQYFEKYFGSVAWLLLALFLITLPLIFTKKILDPVLYSRYLYLGFFMVVLSLIVGIRIIRNRFVFFFSRTDKIIFGALLLFVIVNIFSSIGVYNVKEAIFHTVREGILALVFFLLYQLLRNTPQGKDVLIKSIVIMTFVFLTIALIQLAGADFTQFKAATQHYGYYFRQAISEVKSTLANVNPFASFLVLSLPFSVYSLLFYNKYWKVFAGIVTGLSLFFIFILASKASWGALAMAILVLIVCLYVYLFVVMPRETGQKLSLYGTVSVILFPIIMGIAGLYFVQKTDIKVVKIISEKVQQVLSPEKSLHSIYNTDNPTSAQTRTLVWANTIQMARDNPLFGVGPGQWRIVYAKYGVDGFEHDIRNGLKHFQRPHNDFLWILGETGFLGLITYIIIYIGILVTAFRMFYRSKSKKDRLLALFSFAFLIGFMINLFVSFPRERVSHNMLFLSMFALVLNTVPVDTVKKLTLNNVWVKWLIGLLLLCFTLVNLVLAWQVFHGEQAARAVRYGTGKKNFQMVLRAARSVQNTIYTMDPFTTPMSYHQGVALSALKQMDEAKEAFSQAYAIHPFHLQVLNNLGTSFDLTGNKREALEYYKKALEISPRYKEVLMNTAIVHYNLNEFEESMEYILRIPAEQKNNPEKFKETMLTISKRYAISLSDSCDIPKLKDWIADENKIEATFVKVQQANSTFKEVLLAEVGK